MNYEHARDDGLLFIAGSEASGIIFLTALNLKIFIIRDDLLNTQCIGQ